VCGIAGWVARDKGDIDESVLRAMARSIAHRGPDGEGVWITAGVGLAHRRLSILDLSDAASQPMISPRNGSVLVFNGEIYNFARVRDQLAGHGESFTSSGDTEVLHHALDRWGEDALPRVHGMFAFAYWHPGRRELLLARDRFGKKPIYYAPLGGERGVDGVIFASEMRALLAHPRVRAERSIDPVALAQYLTHEYVPAPRSILGNVRKLLPGQMLRWRDGVGFRIVPYYAPRHHRATKGRPKELVQRFTDLVQEATRERLVADVPVGIFLSGGLDSSFVAACATKVHPHVKTFSVGFDDPSFDESRHARAVAEHLGTEHIEEKLSLDTMIDIVPSTLDWIDEPFADSSMVPTSLLARITRKHVTVALSGDGGDEILAGYPTFQVENTLGWLPAIPHGMASAVRSLASTAPRSDGNFSFAFKLQQFAQGLDDRGARRHARWLAPMLPEQAASLLTSSYAEAVSQCFEDVDAATRDARNAFDAVTAFYLRVYLGEGVLTKVDRATMRSSLESRAPLLDTRVVEFCLGLDPSLRIRGTTTKWLMRQALAPMMPRSIVERPKKGFGAPVGAWLRGPLRALLLDTLSPSQLKKGGLLRPDAVEPLVDAHLTGRRDHRKALWALLVLEHWRQRWFA
jgi:asparagine synthase (glutamine-hydrolysing)